MRRWILPVSMIAAACVISILAYGRLPEQVPIHWDMHGNVDRYASKPFALFLMPVLMTLLYVLVRFGPAIDPNKANLKKNKGDIAVINFFTLLTLLIVHGLTILNGMDYDINMSIIAPLIAGAIFVVIGNFLPRFKHNYTVGIKTPWTLANEQVWRKSNLIGGRFFFGGGLIMMLSIFLPNMWMIIVFFTTLAVTTLAPIVISFYYFKKHNTTN